MAGSSFSDYVMNDLLSGFRGVRSRKMFGGYGIFKGGAMFALIAEEELYYKVGDLNRRDFEKMGSEPFRYVSRGKSVALSYWKLPAEVMDDLEALTEWTEKAIRVVLSSRIASGRNSLQKCLPCEGAAKPLGQKEIKSHLASVSKRWKYAPKDRAIRAELKTKGFMEAVRVIQKIAGIAERENHHPDLHLTGYKHLTIVLNTHAIGGLSINDFILAAKIDKLMDNKHDPNP